jgi:hypothetical protein
MENYILWIVIAAYLFFVLLKSKKGKTPEKKQTVTIANQNDYEAAVITAAIAAALGSEKEVVVKSFFLVGSPDKYNSSWKTAGRTEAMMKKILPMKK